MSKLIKNSTGSKQVKILETKYQVIVLYAQLSSNGIEGEALEEDLIEFKNFKTVKAAEKWANKVLRN